MRWQVDKDGGMVTFRIRAVVPHLSWVGVGFSDYGSLAESDMCVLWTDWKGVTRITDVHTDKVDDNMKASYQSF